MQLASKKVPISWLRSSGTKYRNATLFYIHLSVENFSFRPRSQFYFTSNFWYLDYGVSISYASSAPSGNFGFPGCFWFLGVSWLMWDIFCSDQFKRAIYKWSNIFPCFSPRARSHLWTARRLLIMWRTCWNRLQVGCQGECYNAGIFSKNIELYKL